MNVVNTVLGFALLLLGRNLIWLLVGILGFLVGFDLATDFLTGQAQLLIFVIAVIVGLIGAGLAVFLQRLAAGVAAFLAGGYLAMTGAAYLGLDLGDYRWLAFIAVGIIAAILGMALFDWALIVLSALIGAALIVQNLSLAQSFTPLVFIILVVIGIAVQAGLMQRRQAPPPSRQPTD